MAFIKWFKHEEGYYGLRVGKYAIMYHVGHLLMVGTQYNHRVG